MIAVANHKRGRRAAAQPEPEPPADDMKGKTCRLYEDMVDLATFVANRRKISVAKLLDPLIRQWLLTEAKIESDKLAAELERRGH